MNPDEGAFLKMRTLTTLTTALACVILLACSDDPSGIESLPECNGGVTVTVSAGIEPTFSWTPACRLFGVLVEEGGPDVWLILSLGSNSITPPVRYGVVPQGATEREDPVPLVAGVTYDVTLARFTGPGDDDGELIANQEFTP